MKRKVVYTDAPPEIEAAIARSRIISSEEAGIPPVGYFQTAVKKTKTTENGITTVRFTPSPEYLETDEWKRFQKHQEAKKKKDTKEERILQMPKKISSLFAGKVAAL